MAMRKSAMLLPLRWKLSPGVSLPTASPLRRLSFPPLALKELAHSALASDSAPENLQPYVSSNLEKSVFQPTDSFESPIGVVLWRQLIAISRRIPPIFPKGTALLQSNNIGGQKDNPG